MGLRITQYNSTFFSHLAEESYHSATILIPVVQRFVRPAKVIDVGCGTGLWLSVWKDFGAETVVGVDGDYVDVHSLQIETSSFIPMDLARPKRVASAPFDLVQSLEVAEHLPPDAAANFVRFLCSLGPIVLFSAAIPYQGGTSHINEQWPEYWAELFEANDYCIADVLRPAVWDNPGIAYHYAQNSFLFVSRDHLGNYPGLSGVFGCNGQHPLARVHPRKWEHQVRRAPDFEEVVGALPGSTLALMRRIFRRATRTIAQGVR